MGIKLSDIYIDNPAPTPLATNLIFEVTIPAPDTDSVDETSAVTSGDIARMSLPTVNTISSTSHNMVAADAGTYMRFTNASAKTLTVQADTTAALDANSEFHGRNVGAGDLTILAANTDIIVHEPADGSSVIPQGGTFTLKRVAADEFDLFGVTVPA